MAGWLSKIRGASSPEPALQEPFDVVCDCGGHLTGVRAPQPQRPKCTICGRTVFVLPLNVYPGMLPPPAGAAKAAAAATAATGKKPTSGKGSKSEAAAPVAPARAEELLDVPREPWFTPVRIVIGLTLLVLVSSGYVGIRQWKRAHARQVLPVAREEGLAAFARGEFKVAADRLGAARRAIQLLGLNDAAAQDVLQVAAEAEAASGLVSADIAELVDLALREKEGDAGARRTFETLYLGQWLLLDGVANVTPGESTAARATIDLGLRIKNLRVEAVVDQGPLLDWIQHAAAAGSAVGTTGPQATAGAAASSVASARCIVAGQINRIEVVASPQPLARIVLKSDSLLFWQQFPNYVAVGYTPGETEQDSATQRVLDGQRDFLRGQR